MTKFCLRLVIVLVCLVSANTFAQQTQTPLTPQPSISSTVAPVKGATKIPTVSQEAISTSSGSGKKSAKSTEGYKVDEHLSREKRAEIRIGRIEQRVGALTDVQKTKLTTLFVTEFEQLEQAKANVSSETKSPFGAIRKKTDEQVRALLTPEQLAKYNLPVARKSGPQTSKSGHKVAGTPAPTQSK